MPRKKDNTKKKTVAEQFTFSDNTFSADKVSDPKRRVQLEVGDSKEPSRFLPQVKFLYWDNECNFSARLVDSDLAGGIFGTDEDKMTWQRGDRLVRLYNKDDIDAEDGGFEFDVTLLKKPSDNKIEFSVKSKGLRYHKQLPLHMQVELGEGETADDNNHYDKDGNVVGHRPEHVVNSYAVYHSTKKHNFDSVHYRTGKVFHLHRPWAEDATGERVWCDLDIDTDEQGDGSMVVTVPQDFLDRAVYPVLIDPTFGKTAIGGTSAAVGSNSNSISGANAYTAGSSDVVTQYSVYGFSSIASQAIPVTLYSNTATVPDARAFTPDDVTFTNVAGWYSTSTLAHALTGSVEYSVCFGNPASNSTFYYDSTTGNNRSRDTTQNNLGNATWTNSAWSAAEYSGYATYTGNPSVMRTLQYAVFNPAQKISLGLQYGITVSITGTGSSITPLFDQSNVQETNTTTTLADTDTRIDNLANGVKYLVYYQMSVGAASTTAEMRGVLEFGGTVYANMIFEGSSSGTPASVTGAPVSGFVVVTGDGTSDLVLRFALANSTGTVTVGAKMLIAIPLADLVEDTDYFYNENTNTDTDQVTNAGTTYSTLLSETQTFTAGNYLVLMSAELAPNTTTAAGLLKFTVDGTTQKVVNSIDGEATTSKQYTHHSFAGVMALSGSQTLAIQVASETGATCDARRGRIFVVNLAAFDQYQVTQDTTGDTETTARGTYISTAFTPNQTEYVLVLGNAVLWQSTDFRSVLMHLSNSTDGTDFPTGASNADDIGWDDPSGAGGGLSGRFSMTVGAVEQITSGSGKTYVLEYGVEQPTATANINYGDLIVLGLTTTGGIEHVTAFEIKQSLQYEISAASATPHSLTKSLQYAVTSTPTAITKSLAYEATAPKSVTKSLQYKVSHPEAAGDTTYPLQYEIRDRAYSYGGGYDPLPSDDAQLDNPYSNAEYAEAAVENDAYVEANADLATYALHQFKKTLPSNTKTVAIRWNGRTTTAASVSTVYMQIYNYNTTSWETIATNTTAAADTDFTIDASMSSNLSDYHDGNNRVTFRVYQLEPTP